MVRGEGAYIYGERGEQLVVATDVSPLELASGIALGFVKFMLIP